MSVMVKMQVDRAMMLTWTPSGLMAMKLLVGHVISQAHEDTPEW